MHVIGFIIENLQVLCGSYLVFLEILLRSLQNLYLFQLCHQAMPQSVRVL